jgi:hypothetical protein
VGIANTSSPVGATPATFVNFENEDGMCNSLCRPYRALVPLSTLTQRSRAGLTHFALPGLLFRGPTDHAIPKLDEMI